MYICVLEVSSLAGSSEFFCAPGVFWYPSLERGELDSDGVKIYWDSVRISIMFSFTSNNDFIDISFYVRARTRYTFNAIFVLG